MNDPPLEVKVWARMACYTRPENKVERVSYPVMTPSAARGVLEAIFWKPEFTYQVREIAVLSPIRFTAIRRNEITNKASARSDAIFADDPSVRTQRITLALSGEAGRELSYIIRADAVVKPGVEENPAKYRDQFRRRVQRGQCYHRPYLGCREFACEFGPPTGKERPIQDSRELGLILFDIAFGQGPNSQNVPLFFEAKLENGVLRVPEAMYRHPEAIRS